MGRGTKKTKPQVFSESNHGCFQAWIQWNFGDWHVPCLDIGWVVATQIFLFSSRKLGKMNPF